MLMVYEILIVVSLSAILLLLLRRLPSFPLSPFEHNLESEGESRETPEEILKRADRMFLKKKYDLAEKMYLNLISKDTQNPKIYSRLGVVYLEKRDYKNALENFQKSLDLNNKVASRYFNLGLAYQGLMNRKNALIAFKKAADLEPKNQKYQRMVEKLSVLSRGKIDTDRVAKL